MKELTSVKTRYLARPRNRKIRVAVVLFMMVFFAVVLVGLSRNKEELAASGNSDVSKSEPVLAMANEDVHGSVEAEEAPIITVDEQDSELFQVVSVVDGDTIKVNYDGTVTSVRLIGVNTPETVDPRKTVECFGVDASNYLKGRLTGQQVELVADSSQANYDKYNRLLRYVYLGAEDIGLSIIENGYGYEYTYNVPYQKQSVYRSAQQEASNYGRGLWADETCAGKL